MLPLDTKDIQNWSKRESPAHSGKLRHSIDFFVPEGTKVYAAFGGRVIYVKQDSNAGGNHRRFWFMGNRIVLRHKNSEYTAYEHLKYRGSKVKAGQSVRKGQVIGYSGNTGYTSRPHLHFEVFNEPDKDESEGTTLQVSFRELKN